ncbi:MAG: hypothetical protein ACPLRA_04630 [Candidatus Saccharicenans sp.]
MSCCNYLNSGFNRAVSKFRLAVYLWLIILVLALVLTSPLSSLLKNNLGHLHVPANPLMPLELNLIEVFLANQQLLGPYAAFLMVTVFFSAGLFVFLQAGVFGRMHSQDSRITFGDFLADGSRYFWKFLLSILVFLPFLFILFLFFKLLASPLNIWSDRAVTEWPGLIAANLRMILFILLWTVFKLLLDMVRIIIVTESKKVIPAYLSALKFLARHFFSLWGLYLLLGLMVVVISGIWLVIGRVFSGSHLPGLLIILLLGQAYILFRLLARQAFIGLEFSYYSAKKEKE